MGNNTNRFIANIGRAAKDPHWALVVGLTQLLPVPLMLKDPEARRIASWAFGKLPRVELKEVFPNIGSIDVKVLRPHDRIMGTSIDVQELIVLVSLVRYLDLNNILE